MSLESKRIRGLNFSPREVNHLFTLALQYKNILENKQTNSVTNSQKHEAWVKIANEFNATSSDLNNRTVDQLKRCYGIKKQTMRKKKAQVRQEALKTGGGPPHCETKNNDIDDLVLSTMDPITVEGYYNQFDSDVFCPISGANSEAVEYVFENSENPIMDEEGAESFPESNIEEEGIRSEKFNWKKFNTNDLKRPLNPALLQPCKKNKNEMQSMQSEVEQVKGLALGSHIENMDLNTGQRGSAGSRGRGTPRRVPDRRRPTATLVRTLASNALAEKYDILADKKNVIADRMIQKMERERLHAEEEHYLRKECLHVDVEIKKKQLEKLSY